MEQDRKRRKEREERKERRGEERKKKRERKKTSVPIDLLFESYKPNVFNSYRIFKLYTSYGVSCGSGFYE